jgi:acyl carrier protein
VKIGSWRFPARDLSLSTGQDEYLSIESQIRDLLVSELDVSRAALASCSSTTPLLGRGLGLDSVETMALIVAIEDRFNISVPDFDLNEALFANLQTLTRYVSQKIAARP